MTDSSTRFVNRGVVTATIALVACLAAIALTMAGLSVSKALAAAPVTTRYEQTDSHLQYVGSWPTYYTSKASGGGYMRANTSGSSVTVTFNGTYLAWVATRGTTLGKALVSLDGGPATAVNLAASSVAYQQTVWNTGTLASQSHTVKIWRDPNNVSGKYISVDALDVAGTLTSVVSEGQGIALTRYEQTDSRLQYVGSWPTYYTSKASGGGYMRANTSGSSVTVTFNGTYLAWVATRGTTLGKALVSLDGGPATAVNLAASSVAYQQTVWNTGTLASQSHTVKIWRDPNNVSGKYISVDALDVAGTLTSVVSEGQGIALTRYEQTDSHLQYVGSWPTYYTSKASGGGYMRANTSGSSVTVTFNGTYLAWVATRGHDPREGPRLSGRWTGDRGQSGGLVRRLPADGVEHRHPGLTIPHREDLAGPEQRERQVHQCGCPGCRRHP